jgi:hypothetical protein
MMGLNGRVFRCGVATAVSVALVLSCGCAGHHWNSIGWFPVHAPEGSAEAQEVRHVAPASGVYKIKFATNAAGGDDDVHTYGGTRRVLHQGDLVGFGRDEAGQVYAIAGDETFPLPERKRAKRTPNYLVWSYHVNNPVGQQLGDALDGIGQAILVAAVVVGVVALVGVGLWLEARYPDTCE